MAQKLGAAEIVEQRPLHLGSDYIEMQLAPSRNAGSAKVTVHKHVADQQTSGKVFGSFSNLGFETEADRKRKARESGAAGKGE